MPGWNDAQASPPAVCRRGGRAWHHIEGMTVPEGRMLLMDLIEHATQRQFVYRHEWRVGNLVMWDNRCVLHRGRRFDFAERREMRRATTADAPS